MFVDGVYEGHAALRAVLGQHTTGDDLEVMRGLGFTMTNVATVQANGYHARRVHAGWLDHSQFGIQALSNTQRARAYGACAVAFSNGQEHVQHVARMLV